MTAARDRVIRALLGAATVLGTAAAVLATTGGGTLAIGPIAVRSHNATRPLLAAVLCLAAAFISGTAGVSRALTWWWNALERHASAAAVCIAAIAATIGIAWGTLVAGGSDSYCYLNQAELFTRGDVRVFEPLALDPAWPGNLWSFAPAGHTPAGNAPGYYVPICPAGYPFLLAAARVAFGRTGMFWVTPLMGGLTVYLAFVLGRRAAGPAAGLLGAALTASSPIVLYQIVQPMNDIPAAAVWTAAILVASTQTCNDNRRALLAGALSGFALTIRPNLVPLAAIVGSAAARPPGSRALTDRVKTLALFGVAVLPGVAAVMAIQWAMYGSPLSSGYGNLSELFALSNVGPNLLRYPAWLVRVHTPLILAAVAAPFVGPPEARTTAVWLLLFAGATFLLYLPYVVFEAWWYLRFVLPAIPTLLALTAAVFVQVLRRLRADVRCAIYVPLSIAVSMVFVIAAARRDAFLLKAHEWRFRSAGEYVATLPEKAFIITSHHTGSVRFYSGRGSVGWGDTPPGRLDEAIAFLRGKGYKPYLLFEEWEEVDFRKRFAGDRLGALAWPPMADIDRRVRIYDPDDYDRHAHGQRVETRRLVTSPW